MVIAKNLAGEMERYYIDLVNIFDVIALYTNHDNSSNKYNKILQSMNFRHICVVDSHSGIIKKSIHTDGSNCPVSFSKQRLSTFKKLASEKKTVLSGVLPTKSIGNAIFAIRRVGNNLIVGAVSTKYLQDLGRKVSFGERGHAAIVDQYGRAISHPRQRLARFSF